MNERIRELALQAGLVKILEEHAHEYGAGTFENTPYPELEKFAELIVRECVEELRYTVLDTQELRRDKSTDYQVGWEDGMFDAEEMIKEHFGVE